MRRQALPAVILAATVVVAGCSGNDDEAKTNTTTASPTIAKGKSGTPRGGGPKSVDRHDSTATGAEALRLTLTADAALDNSPVDAQRRAASLLTPQLAKVLSKPLGGNGGGGAWPGWNDVRTHKGYTRVTTTVMDDDAAPDAPTTSAHRYRAVVTATDGKGWTKPVSDHLWLVTMTRSSTTQPWQVQSLEDQGPAS